MRNTCCLAGIARPGQGLWFPQTRFTVAAVSGGIFNNLAHRAEIVDRLGWRLRATLRHTVNRDAHLAGLVGEVLLDAGAGEDVDADRQAVEHLVIALEWRGLGVFGPVRLEGDLRHRAVAGPDGGGALGALLAATMHQDHVRMLCVDLIETVPNRAVIGGIPTREGNLRPRR